MLDAARATGGKLLFSALTDGRAEKALAPSAPAAKAR